MYKVFFNDSIIQIGSGSKISSKNNISGVDENEIYSFVNQIVSEIRSGTKLTDCFIQHQDIGQLWDYFRSQFVEIQAAGGLVRHNDGKFLFIKRLGVWDLPKGKIEKMETPENAALREVEEECGLRDLKIVRPLGSTYHIYRSPFIQPPKNMVLKESRWFLMNYSGNETPVPQQEEDIEDVQWISLSEIHRVMENTYLSLRDFLNKTLKIS